MKSTWLIALSVGFVAGWLVLPAGAEDVQVKVIEPEKQPADKPADQAGPARSGQPDQPRPERPRNRGPFGGGDRLLQGALGQLELSEQQQARVRPILAELAKRNESVNERLGTELAPMGRQYWQLARKAREQDDVDALLESEELREQMQQANEKIRDQRSANRAQALDRLKGVLSEEQLAGLEKLLADRTSPAGRARTSARWVVGQLLRGITLSDEQKEKLEQVISAGVEKLLKEQAEQAELRKALLGKIRSAHEAGDAETVKKLREELAANNPMSSWRAQYQAGREEIEKILTPEQTEQLAQRQRNFSRQIGGSFVDLALRGTRDLGLSEQQTRQVDALGEAARKAMAELEVSDWPGRRELVRQLRSDIESLLTDEQKETFRKASARPGAPSYRRDGAGNDRAGRVDARVVRPDDQ